MKAASLLPCWSEKAPAPVKSAADAICVVKLEPFARVPEKKPFPIALLLVLTVPVLEVPLAAPPLLVPALPVPVLLVSVLVPPVLVPPLVAVPEVLPVPVEVPPLVLPLPSSNELFVGGSGIKVPQLSFCAIN